MNWIHFVLRYDISAVLFCRLDCITLKTQIYVLLISQICYCIDCCVVFSSCLGGSGGFICVFRFVVQSISHRILLHSLEELNLS